MLCKFCKEKKPTVFLPGYRVSLCDECYVNFYQRKVERTIKKFKLANKEQDRILVAFSGQKDSLALAAALARTDWQIELLHINLKIVNYSDRLEDFVRKQVELLNLKLHIVDLKKEYGYSLTELKGSRPICSACGLIKRYIMNKFAREHNFTRIATGHHATDELITLLKNWIGGQTEYIIKQSPFLPSSHEKLVPKIKPLWNTTEEENRLYVQKLELPVFEEKCPNAKIVNYQRIIDTWKKLYPRLPIEQTLLNNFLKTKKSIIEKTEQHFPYNECIKCGEITSGTICTFCKLIDNARNKKQ